MSQNKIKDIDNWKEPQSVHEVQKCRGFANFNRRVIGGYSAVTCLLNNLTKKDQPYNWNQECETVFDEVQNRFISAPNVVNNHPERQKIVETDASNLTKGTVLSQLELEGNYHTIDLYSKRFSDTELNYDIHDKEMGVIVDCFKDWGDFLHSRRSLI